MSANLRPLRLGGRPPALDKLTPKDPRTKINTSDDVFETCYEAVKEHDEKLCRELKDEVNFLMVVTGLFLAIVVPFTIESNKLLQEDKQDTTAQLLVEVVRLLNDTSARGHAELPERFIADHRDVLVNQLWYLSTVLNLVAVLIGTFCLQWISAFERGDDSRRNSSSAADMLKARCIRSAGFIGWGVNHTPELLLLIVQLSIALFTSGLVYFLWSINNAAAKPALAIAGITGIMLCLANVIPFLQPLLAVLRPSMLARHCPYKSPTSWFVRLVCDSLVLTFLSFKKSRDIGCNCIGVGERFRFWLGLLPAPWRDYQWKAYNESYVRCLQMFDQAPERFMGLGLPAVLDILISKRDIVDITCRFIQGIRQITDRDKTLCVFGVNEHDVLKSIEQRTHKDGPEFEKFMDNFTDLLIVNLLAAKSPKVHRSLVLHCVEMYTQLKESIFSIFDDLDVPAVFTIFDRCKVTPLVSQWDVNGWGIEIKFKFLKYMNCALDAKLPIPTYDFDTAIYIIEVDEERLEPPSPSGYNINVENREGHSSEVSFEELCRLVKEKMDNRSQGEGSHVAIQTTRI